MPSPIDRLKRTTLARTIYQAKQKLISAILKNNIEAPPPEVPPDENGFVRIYDYLRNSLPSDHCKQTRATELIASYYSNQALPTKILDLGCGAGGSIDFFRRAFRNASWTGVDIELSPEVSARSRNDGDFFTYDGENLPFPDNSFDLVYSNQVLEHVRYPEKVLAEVARVMTPNGLFFGQTSQLEPYHSYSIFNFTVYGFKKICEDNGLAVKLLRPGIDGVTLIERSVKGKPKEYSRWFGEESPINREIEKEALSEGVAVKTINYRKLLHCGQFSFICRRA